MEVHGRTDNRTDGQTDVQADSYIPLAKVLLRGYKKKELQFFMTSRRMNGQHKTKNIAEDRTYTVLFLSLLF